VLIEFSLPPESEPERPVRTVDAAATKGRS
jgi:hypothetical protein